MIKEIKSQLNVINGNIMLADGLDKALVGYVEGFGKETVALYDKDKVIDILIESGMSCEEAIEYFEVNIIGAYVGDFTPAFATLWRDKK